MPTERLSVTFLYTVGDLVRWDRAGSQVFRIVWRRWHHGEASTWIEYGLVGAMNAHHIWHAYEPDLEPLEDTTHA